MTIDDAVKLLRQARDVCEYPEFIPSSGNISHARKVRARIDAALAAHDAEPAEVEWREYGGHAEDASIDGAHCILRFVGPKWHWDVMRTGTAQSLYDARAAAEKAARGVR
jgi:hypothetical protein